jgi:hypothetical protein
MKAFGKFIQDFKSSQESRGSRDVCGEVNQFLEDYLMRENATKTYHLQHCDGSESCHCGSDGGKGMVDFIVLISTNKSMSQYAAIASEAVGKALTIMREKCPSDMRVAMMGVEGTWLSTNFTTNHLTYLKALDNSHPFAADATPVGNRREQGANAIEDLSKYYDWRAGACRAIFYISDDELDGNVPVGDFANETAATNAAIAAANAHNVTVFADYETHLNRAPQITQNYQSLCNSTGGLLYLTANPSYDSYIRNLSEAMCKACGSCKTAEIPALAPCISIHWGDSDCDCAETDDLEVMHITVCNCYSNVTFSNFSISYIMVVDENGNEVPYLPDGTPSVQALPVGPYCFGNIGPCVDGVPTCKSRQFVFSARGAKAGKYMVYVGAVCYDVCFHYDTNVCFEITLCNS